MVEARSGGAHVASRIKHLGEELRRELRPLLRNLSISKDFDSGLWASPGRQDQGDCRTSPSDITLGMFMCDNDSVNTWNDEPLTVAIGAM